MKNLLEKFPKELDIFPSVFAIGIKTDFYFLRQERLFSYLTIGNKENSIEIAKSHLNRETSLVNDFFLSLRNFLIQRLLWNSYISFKSVSFEGIENFSSTKPEEETKFSVVLKKTNERVKFFKFFDEKVFKNFSPQEIVKENILAGIFFDQVKYKLTYIFSVSFSKDTEIKRIPTEIYFSFGKLYYYEDVF